MRRILPLLTMAAATLLAGCGGGDNGYEKFTAAVFGDVPYGTSPTDTTQFQQMPAFVKWLNDDASVSLALHGGDLHSGKEYCTQAFDQSLYDIFKTLKAPMVYTPGDNEWADCHKAGEGGGTYSAATGSINYVTDASGKPVDYASGDPAANLAMVRSLFFPTAGQTVGGAMSVHSQAQEYDRAFPTDAQFVENVWFERGGVLFVAVNIPGGSNNGTDPWYGAPSMGAAQQQEVANRTGATQRWLKAAFDRAELDKVVAVAILTQADMWDFDGKAASHIAGYKPYLDTIAARAASFGKPVLLLNGDSHTYRSDNPMVKGAACVTESGAATVACNSDAYTGQPYYNVPNFHRVIWHGSTLPMEWLKLTVDGSANAAASATAFGPFSWQRVIRN